MKQQPLKLVLPLDGIAFNHAGWHAESVLGQQSRKPFEHIVD